MKTEIIHQILHYVLGKEGADDFILYQTKMINPQFSKRLGKWYSPIQFFFYAEIFELWSQPVEQKATILC